MPKTKTRRDNPPERIQFRRHSHGHLINHLTGAAAAHCGVTSPSRATLNPRTHMRRLLPPMAIIAITSIILMGCVNQTLPAPSFATHGLALETKSSRCIKVEGARFQISHGNLELAGSVARNIGAGTTAFSHLDVLFRDSSSRILQTKPIRFNPRSVGNSRFGSRRAYYSLNLDGLPAGTTHIEVQAHDAEISAAHETPRAHEGAHKP